MGNLYLFLVDLLEQTPAVNADFKEAYYEARDLLELPEVQKALEFALRHPEMVYGDDPAEYWEACSSLQELLGLNAHTAHGLGKYFADKAFSAEVEGQ